MLSRSRGNSGLPYHKPFGLPLLLRLLFLVERRVEGHLARLEVELADELQASLAPCSRSMPLSSHSTDSGPV